VTKYLTYSTDLIKMHHCNIYYSEAFQCRLA